MLMFLTYIIKSLLLIIYVMLMVAFYTILERKIIAYIQRRTGPNLVGPFGLLQAIADGLKLLVKKTIIPQTANIMIFIAGPLITFNLSYLGWCIIPFDKSAVFVNTPLSILELFQEIDYIYFLDKVSQYINLWSKLNSDQISFRIFCFLVYLCVLYFNFKTDAAFFKKTQFLILNTMIAGYMSFTFFNEQFFEVDRITIISIRIIIVTFLVSIALFKFMTEKKDKNDICFKSLSPVVGCVTSFCEYKDLSEFIICFEPLSEISAFEISKNGKDTKAFHPICKSPYSIYNYTLVGYVLNTDIKDLNWRYQICTSYSNQIRDFNHIINYLITHFEKSSKIQNENVEKLTSFLSKLQNKNEGRKVFYVF